MRACAALLPNGSRQSRKHRLGAPCEPEVVRGPGTKSGAASSYKGGCQTNLRSWSLPNHGDRRSDFDIVKEFLRHLAWRSDAAKRSGIAGKLALMHANATGYAHKEWHWRALENCARWLWVLAEVDIFLDDVPGSVNIIPVQIGGVVLVFLNDLKRPRRRVETFPARRDLRNTNKLVASVEIGSLLSQIDRHGWRALDTIAVPIRTWSKVEPSSG